MSKFTKIPFIALFLIAFLAACAAPPSTPAIVSPLPPTATQPPPIPTATSEPLSGFFRLQMLTPSDGWAETVNLTDTSRVLKTVDGGQTWSDVTPALIPAGSLREFFLSETSAWAFNFNDPSSSLAHTTDGGLTWQKLPPLPVPTDFTVTAITFQDENTGWFEFASPGAGSDDIGYFITHDGGQTWSQVRLSAPPDHPDLALGAIDGTLHTCMMCRDVIYFDPARVMVVYGDLSAPGTPSNTLTLSISQDLGRTWKNLTLTPPASGIINENELPFPPVFFGPKDGLLPFGFAKYDSSMNISQTQLILYATHDGGLTWTAAGNSLVPNVDVLKSQSLVDIVSPQVVFFPCGSDLCVKQDGGKTWQILKSNLNFNPNNGAEYVQTIDFVSSTTGWAITTDGTNDNLWKTLDGGVTWQKLSPVILP